MIPDPGAVSRIPNRIEKLLNDYNLPILTVAIPLTTPADMYWFLKAYFQLLYCTGF